MFSAPASTPIPESLGQWCGPPMAPYVRPVACPRWRRGPPDGCPSWPVWAASPMVVGRSSARSSEQVGPAARCRVAYQFSLRRIRPPLSPQGFSIQSHFVADLRSRSSHRPQLQGTQQAEHAAGRRRARRAARSGAGQRQGKWRRRSSGGSGRRFFRAAWPQIFSCISGL